MRGSILLISCLIAVSAWADPGNVLPELLPFESPRSLEQWRDTVGDPVEPTPEGVAPSQMLAQYLVDRVDAAAETWAERFESLESPEAVAAHQADLRERLVDAIGGFPDRTPLNARITGTLHRPGYRVEKVLFESLPGFYVTGALFLPDGPEYAPPYPGMLVPCGHWPLSKAWSEYQSMGALLALSGMAAFVFDPIEQGERGQVPESGVHNVDGHNALGPGSIVLGRSTTWFYLWDAIRALDYLAQRPEVDPERLGCTGNSGGGTQTLFITAVDDRIVAAAPSCALSHMTSKDRRSPGDVEQHIYGQLAFGLDEPDYLMMRAPDVAWFVCTTTEDFVDIYSAWRAVRSVKRLYTRLGHPERVNLLEQDAPHSYGKTQREAVARWMALWLRGERRAIEEPELDLFTAEELQVMPEGWVMRLGGARNAYDINATRADELRAVRERLWRELSEDELRARVREITGIRPLSELPEAEIDELSETDDGSEKLVLRPEKGIYLPACVLAPETSEARGYTLYLDEWGKEKAFDSDAVRELRRSGEAVIAADVRGCGETAPDGPAEDGNNFFRAFDLGRTLLTMRAEDILVFARYLSEARAGGAPVGLMAVGDVGVAALHAAAVEPQLFRAVTVSGALESYDRLARTPVPETRWSTVVYGALEVYDLPDLAQLIGADRVVVKDGRNAHGRPLTDPLPRYGAELRHRWRFDSADEGYSPDDVGGADALLRGAAVTRDGAAELDDGTATEPGWIELPVGETLARFDRGLTLEAWITEAESRGGAKLWSFGSGSGDELCLWPEYGNGYSRVVSRIAAAPDAPWRAAFNLVPLEPGRPHHLAVTFYRDEWTREMRLYVDGECVNLLRNPDMPDAIDDYARCFLGRSCDPGERSAPPWKGRIHEFRIYDGALPYDDIRANREQGPDGAG